jgi:hypothetical protein
MSVELVEDLKKKTVPQLKSYAKKNNIDLFGVNTKVEILEVIFSFIPRPEQVKAMKNKDKPTDKIALYSIKNLHWNGVGDLERGYNIVSKEDSERWLVRRDVRVASADEVAKFYGKKKK